MAGGQVEQQVGEVAAQQQREQAVEIGGQPRQDLGGPGQPREDLQGPGHAAARPRPRRVLGADQGWFGCLPGQHGRGAGARGLRGDVLTAAGVQPRPLRGRLIGPGGWGERSLMTGGSMKVGPRKVPVLWILRVRLVQGCSEARLFSGAASSLC